MRKVARIAALLLVTILCVGVFSTPTFAASKTSLSAKANQATKKLVNYGEYQGWTADVGPTKVTDKKAVVKVTLRNSKHVFANIAVTSTTKKTYYRFKKYNHTFTDWKIGLKKYAISSDKKALLKTKAKTKANSIAKVAQNNAWTVKRSSSYKNGKAYQTIKVSNPSYNKKIIVVAQRKKGKVAVSYKLGGKAMSLKNIKSWLSSHSCGYAEVTGGGGETPPAPVEGPADDSESAILSDDPDFSGYNGDMDVGTTGEPILPPTP